MDYNQLVHSYVRTFANMYTMQITKCCGYSEIIVVPRDILMSTLYDLVKNTFGFQNLFTLYVKDANQSTLILDSSFSLRQFILQYPTFFSPVFPIPDNLVYRIYYNVSGSGCCICCSAQSVTMSTN